jgi:glycosyltransferase involved in cell wall biosynthesis
MLPLHNGFFSKLQYDRFTDRIIAVSNAAKDVLVGCGLPGEMISVVWDAVNTEDRWTPRPKNAQVMKEFGLSENDVVVGVAARLGSGSMDVPAFIKAFARVAPNYPSAKLLLVGRGGEKMAAIAQAAGISDRVICPGFRADMPEVHSVMDVFVQPSVKAAGGNAVLEAMSMGKPVLATPVGGIPEAVENGVTGKLFRDGTVEAMAEPLSELLADSDLRMSMGRAGRERAHRFFNVEGMIDGVEEVYKETIRRAVGVD